MAESIDAAIRTAAFDWLTEKRMSGEALGWHALRNDFFYRGQRVPLMGASGIWKPAQCDLPISATTTYKSPYRDRLDPSTGSLEYAYRREGPTHHQNIGLSRARSRRVPIIYFHAIEEGVYVAAYPVLVVGEDPTTQFFRLQVEDRTALRMDVGSARVADDEGAPRREYVTRSFKFRVHQEKFRERVLRAYQERCSLCRLGHRPLLDAAHISPDASLTGEPVVTNGLALCKLHHVAFDQFFFAVRPDYKIEVRQSILDETDGPMLVVGLQRIDGQRINLPRRRNEYPDRDRLAQRYAEFREAS